MPAATVGRVEDVDDPRPFPIPVWRDSYNRELAEKMGLGEGKPKCAPAPGKRAYLAGPIRGDREYASKFEHAKRVLEAKGWTVWSPADNIREKAQTPGVNRDDRRGMADDIAALVTCDAVMVQTGWAASSGTKAEVAVAKALLIPVYEPGEWPSV